MKSKRLLSEEEQMMVAKPKPVTRKAVFRPATPRKVVSKKLSELDEDEFVVGGMRDVSISPSRVQQLERQYGELLRFDDKAGA